MDYSMAGDGGEDGWSSQPNGRLWPIIWPKAVLGNQVLFDHFFGKVNLPKDEYGGNNDIHGQGWPCIKVWGWRVVVLVLIEPCRGERQAQLKNGCWRLLVARFMVARGLLGRRWKKGRWKSRWLEHGGRLAKKWVRKMVVATSRPRLEMAGTRGSFGSWWLKRRHGSFAWLEWRLAAAGNGWRRFGRDSVERERNVWKR